MKKGLLWTALCFLVVGVGMSWGGRAMGGSTEAKVNLFGQNFYMYCAPSYVVSGGPWLNGGDSADQEVERISDNELSAFQSLDIDVDLGDVNIVEGNTYAVELVSWGLNYELDYSNQDGVLKIWNAAQNGISLNASRVGCNVTVTVPEGTTLERLDLDLDLGNADLDGITVKQADLNLELGNVSSYDMTVTERLSVKADLGDVNLSGDFRGAVDIEASLGSVELNFAGPISDYSYEMYISLGTAYVNGEKYSNEDVSGGRGSNTIQVNADLGDVEMNFGV